MQSYVDDANGRRTGRGRARGRIWTRAAIWGLGAGLVLLLTGDRGALTATPQGIDPLDVLKLQVKNNVLFIVDTSGSMKWPLDQDNFSVGADDPESRMYQAKQAVKAVVTQNQDTVNFGLATYSVLASTKRLNGTGATAQENFDGDGFDDGPLVYVSQDANAAVYYQNYYCPSAGTNRVGFFCHTSDSYNTFSQTSSQGVFRSFANGSQNNNNTRWNAPYPAGCTPGVDCRYYMQSKMFRNGVQYTWDLTNNSEGGRLVATTPATCPAPPNGLLADNDPTRPCFQFVDNATGNVTTFYYTSAIFASGSFNGCGGAATITAVAPCDDLAGQAAAVATIQNGMQPEVPLTTALAEYPTLGPDLTNGDNPTVAGLRAAQGTPLAAALVDVRTANPAMFPPRPVAVASLQKNFVILLTDGDDTCASNDGDTAARIAGQAAQALFANTGDPQHQAETIVIAFTSAVNINRANIIAKGGSGGNVQNDGTVICPVGATCRDAYTATNLQELIDALNNAIQLAASTGTFSASQGILSTVFELGPTPLDPRTRYDQRVNIFYQSSFDIPDFDGHLEAFRNDGTFLPLTDNVNFTGNWDAGETLFEQNSQVMEQTDLGRGPDRFTFDELHGGADVRTMPRPPVPVAPASGPPLIRRRIFTSSPVDGTGTSRLNRTYQRSLDSQYDSAQPEGSNLVALWPPNQTGLANTTIQVDPTTGPGALDQELGIASLTFAELQSQFGACKVSTDPSSGPLPAPCAASDVDYARKEAREIILAWTAGAELIQGADKLPIRATDGTNVGLLLYKDRGWILKDTTLAQMAVATPPLKTTPGAMAQEWVLYRDGRRDSSNQGINEISKGFGLRNPDYDDANPTTKIDLKPVMTVVYLPANDGLHAFSAETSEELWTFVPIDQLGKLKDLIGGQLRDPHTYMIASSIRLADVFIPGSFTLGGFSYSGRWRTVLYFGRGIGGQFYTALDVTSPGPFTLSQTGAVVDSYPPWVLWNRGNDGTDASFLSMGQTWSTPAVGDIGGAVFRIWTGSGYGTGAGASMEGTTFYMMDAVTGDVLMSKDVGDGVPTYIADNALVASPTAYNAFQLDPPGAANRSQDRVSRIYIPDIHGRIWKFDTSSGGQFADLGPTQPFGNAVSLLKLGSDGYVFAESGNDNRVPDGLVPPFRAYGFQDTEGDGGFTLPGTIAFTLDFPAPGPSNVPFRGTSQPATAFNDQGKGRVFFAGTRFNPAGTNCLSSYDTILYGVGAQTGAAVYDFDNNGSADLYTILTGNKAPGVATTGGQVVLGSSGTLSNPPAPPPPPGAGFPPPAPPTPATIVTTGIGFAAGVCSGF